MRFTAKFWGELQSRLVEGSVKGSGSDFGATAGTRSCLFAQMNPRPKSLRNFEPQDLP